MGLRVDIVWAIGRIGAYGVVHLYHMSEAIVSVAACIMMNWLGNVDKNDIYRTGLL